MPMVKKPGFGLRAFLAFIVLDLVVAAIMLALLWLLRPYMELWYVILPITAGFLVSQFVILSETIWPVLKDWISQETYVSDTDKRGL